jgi:hypothetical protein
VMSHQRKAGHWSEVIVELFDAEGAHYRYSDTTLATAVLTRHTPLALTELPPISTLRVKCFLSGDHGFR